MIRIAVLVLAFCVVTATLGSARAQESTGSISGRILMDGVVDLNNTYAVLVLPADISQPLNAAAYSSRLISVRGEFTIPNIADGEYLVVLASTHIDPADPELTILFDNTKVHRIAPLAPPRFTKAAVRVRIENVRADREAVFELASGFPATGLPFQRSDRAGHLPRAFAVLGALALAGLGALALASGVALRLRGARGRR